MDECKVLREDLQLRMVLEDLISTEYESLHTRCSTLLTIVPLVIASLEFAMAILGDECFDAWFSPIRATSLGLALFLACALALYEQIGIQTYVTMHRQAAHWYCDLRRDIIMAEMQEGHITLIFLQSIQQRMLMIQRMTPMPHKYIEKRVKRKQSNLDNSVAESKVRDKHFAAVQATQTHGTLANKNTQQLKMHAAEVALMSDLAAELNLRSSANAGAEIDAMPSITRMATTTPTLLQHTTFDRNALIDYLTVCEMLQESNNNRYS